MFKINRSSSNFPDNEFNQLYQSVQDFEKWTSLPVGQAITACQQEIIDNYLQTLFGYHLLQLSVARNIELFNASKVNHKFSFHPFTAESTSVTYDMEAIPLESESIDVVILHHLLSYSANPHQLLKEINRIVLPSGHLIIVGFNPYSIVGLQSLVGRMSRFNKGQKHAFSVSRLSDWLKLIDFSIQKVDYGFYRLPFKFCLNNGINLKLEQKLKGLGWPLGCFYVVQAKKQVMPITPIKLKQSISKYSIIPVMKPSINTAKKLKKNK